MTQTAAERKAKEGKRKAEKGLKRRSFWLSNESIEIIEQHRTKNHLKSNDEAINMLIQKISEM